MRILLGVLRAGLLYAALCFLATAALLQIKADQESGVGTRPGLAHADSAVYDLAFAGVNVDLQQYSDDRECRERLTSLRQHGFGWARQRIDWGEIEPQPGVYRWSDSDADIECIRAAGLVPVIVLDGSPAWARAAADNAADGNSLAPPADPHDFAEFARAFATRYADAVQFYQVWDEPNISPHWGAGWVNPVEYAQLVKLASKSIRSTDPDAVILLGALAPTQDRGHLGIDEVYFLQRLYAAGAQPYFDAIAIQPFGFARTPEDATQRPTVLNLHRAVMVRRAIVAAGDAGTPIVAARYGWNRRPYSPWATVARTDQAEFAAAALGIAYAQWPWLAAMGWAIDRPDAPYTDPIWGFSLNGSLTEAVRAWNAARPARDAFSMATPQPGWQGWVVILLSIVLAMWRLAAAGQALPLGDWRARYRQLPPYVHAGIWMLLLVAYHLATWPPLIVLCWAAAALLILARPSSGLWLAAITLPFYFQHKELQWGALALTVAPSTAVSLCLAPALIMHICRRRLVIDRWSLLAAGWLAVIIVSASGVWHWPAYRHGVMEHAAAPLILFWATRAFTHSGRDRRAVLSALVAGGVFAAGMGLADWLGGGGTEADSVRRLVGPYYSANHAALYLVRTLFLALGLAMFYRPITRWLYVATVALVALALILTASRGALFLGLPAGFVVLGFLATRPRTPSRKGKQVVGVAVIAVATFASVLVGAVALSWARLSNSATIVERWHLWQNAAALWRDHWFAGIGPNGFFWSFPAYIPTGSNLDPNLLHPHNLWLEFATTGGILALAWLLIAAGMVIRTFYAAWSSPGPAPNWPAFGILAALAASLAHAQVDAFAALPDLAAWNWMVVGVLAAGLTGAHTVQQHPTAKEKPP